MSNHATNLANAQHSTGPITPEGKARSSMNALKHGLTGKTVLLPSEDPAEYQQELDFYLNRHQPANEQEIRLVQSILDSAWRLNRIQLLEAALLFKGHIEFANKYDDRPEIERRHLIRADTYLKYEKQLRNLNIQEARLRRNMEKDTAELLRLQTIRKREESPSETKNGFDFATQPDRKPVTTESTQEPREAAA